MKDMLAANIADATHDWASLLPQLRMEYMQRRHSVTAYSPSELVHAHPLRLPPPVGPNHPPISDAAVQLPVPPEETFIQRRHECSDIMASRVYDHILKAQQRNADKQAFLPLARLVGGGNCNLGHLSPAGDLAYVIERGLATKNSVTGPFVFESISGGQAHLRTTRRVPDQEVCYFSIHIERVARCTTITDVLEKLLRAAAYPAEDAGSTQTFRPRTHRCIQNECKHTGMHASICYTLRPLLAHMYTRRPLGALQPCLHLALVMLMASSLIRSKILQP